MATASKKGPTDGELSSREDGALGFALAVHDLPVATAVRPAGACGEDAVKEAAKVRREAASEAQSADGGDS